MKYNAGVVTYTYKLLDNEQHAAGLGQNTLPERFLVTVKDTDGSTATATLDVKIIDDVPSISITGTSDKVAEEGTVNGTWSQKIGADQNGAATVVVVGANTYALGTPIAVTGGTLTVKADGTWTFVAGTNINNADATPDVVNFTIRVTDGDGDVATDTHEINITDGNGPSIAGKPLALIVDDQNLADGSTPANSDFAQGVVSFTAGSDDITSFVVLQRHFRPRRRSHLDTRLRHLDRRSRWRNLDRLAHSDTSGIHRCGRHGNVTVTATLHDNYDSHPGIGADDLVGLGSVGIVTDTSTARPPPPR